MRVFFLYGFLALIAIRKGSIYDKLCMMQREFLGYITLALFPCHDPKNRSAVTNGDYPGERLVAIYLLCHSSSG